ncbi:MAG: GNAT family N-acetyltransferase [Lachnospiraceae bacterium]|nr:GNAT family N-acetyltransferase [Lachnospiraceae bacterium]
MGIFLRKALETDCRLYFNWANDSAVRAASFSQDEIKWDDHVKWFKKKLKDEDAELFVCMDFLRPLGQVRIERDEDDPVKAYISYSIDEALRGRGVGKKMLILAEKEIGGADNGINKLVAKVKPENKASLKVFEALGYDVVRSEDEDCVTFEKWIGSGSDIEINKDRKPREAGLELLRILAMMMVITLHYLDKGGLLADWKEGVSGKALPFWILEAMCLCSVNVYVMISGYFYDRSRFSVRKAVMMWLRVLFYSLGIAVIVYSTACLSGTVGFSKEWFSLHNVLFYAFPVVNGHYWFATSFILLYLMTPFLSAAINKTDKFTHGAAVAGLLILCCVAKSFIPYEIVDDRGNGILWFIVLYITAAYVKRYGVPFIKKGISAFVWYVAAVAGIIFSYRVFALVGAGLHGAEYPVMIPSAYNFIFVFLASLALLVLFAGMNFGDNIITKCITSVSPYVFGVYLLHEHYLIRFKWVRWLGVGREYGPAGRIRNYILSVLAVFVIGIIVDLIRDLIFRLCEKITDICMKIYFSKKEAFDYLITGGLTTVLNWVAYIMCAYVALVNIIPGEHARENISNVIAWVAAVLFAYVTNRIFVFHSDKTGFVPVMKEFFAFVGARVASFVVEQLLFMFSVYIMNDIVAKLLIGIIVIILNYFFSKLWIFKKKQGEEAE